MSHVAPHRWGDAFAGKLSADEVRELDRHASGCQKCARVRSRVQRVSQSYPTIRAMTPPDLAWDAVRARVHWSVSTERRAKLAPPGRWLATAALAGGAAAAIAVGLGTGELPRSAPGAPAQVAVAGHHDAPPRPDALTGLVSRVAGEVMIDGVRLGDAAGAFERSLGAGTMLATSASGRIDVQFGDASAFALGPRSSLDVKRFDAQLVELAVDGTIDVVVAARAPGQRFLVVAGDDTIEVRGTQFRVTHDATGVTVACRHGLVAVRDARGEIDVSTAQRIELRAGQLLAAAHTVPMSAGELAVLGRATPVSAAWTDAATVGKTSAPLEIATAGQRDVRVDGVELGAAPLRVRVMPGRHIVEAADRGGRFKRVGWVDVALGKQARLDVPAEVAPTGGAAVRGRQLRTSLQTVRAQLDRCTRAAAKDDITHTYAVIDIAIDGGGAKSYLNVVDSDLDSATQECVRDVLADLQFGPGPAASWRERISL